MLIKKINNNFITQSCCIFLSSLPWHKKPKTANSSSNNSSTNLNSSTTTSKTPPTSTPSSISPNPKNTNSYNSANAKSTYPKKLKPLPSSTIKSSYSPNTKSKPLNSKINTNTSINYVKPNSSTSKSPKPTPNANPSHNTPNAKPTPKWNTSHSINTPSKSPLTLQTTPSPTSSSRSLSLLKSVQIAAVTSTNWSARRKSSLLRTGRAQPKSDRSLIFFSKIKSRHKTNQHKLKGTLLNRCPVKESLLHQRGIKLQNHHTNSKKPNHPQLYPNNPKFYQFNSLINAANKTQNHNLTSCNKPSANRL